MTGLRTCAWLSRRTNITQDKYKLQIQTQKHNKISLSLILQTTKNETGSTRGKTSNHFKGLEAKQKWVIQTAYIQYLISQWPTVFRLGMDPSLWLCCCRRMNVCAHVSDCTASVNVTCTCLFTCIGLLKADCGAPHTSCCVYLWPCFPPLTWRLRPPRLSSRQLGTSVTQSPLTSAGQSLSHKPRDAWVKQAATHGTGDDFQQNGLVVEA